MAKKKRFFKKPEHKPQKEEPTKTVSKKSYSAESTVSKDSKIISGLKYIYLTVFFALLAGFFNPLIRGQSFDLVTIGVIVLFVGLGGAVLVYKSTTAEKHRGIYLGIGFGLIFLSLFFIYEVMGRPLLTF